MILLYPETAVCLLVFWKFLWELPPSQKEATLSLQIKQILGKIKSLAAGGIGQPGHSAAGRFI